jgi:hypothetical protein
MLCGWSHGGASGIVNAMRMLTGVLLLWATTGAGAQTIDDESAAGIDSDTLSAVLALATRDLSDPGQAHFRNIHKSLARNGKGYCGEVSLNGGDFTVFHAILEDGTGPSVLRLVDFPESDQSSWAIAVRQMMKNFGCVE